MTRMLQHQRKLAKPYDQVILGPKSDRKTSALARLWSYLPLISSETRMMRKVRKQAKRRLLIEEEIDDIFERRQLAKKCSPDIQVPQLEKDSHNEKEQISLPVKWEAEKLSLSDCIKLAVEGNTSYLRAKMEEYAIWPQQQGEILEDVKSVSQEISKENKKLFDFHHKVVRTVAIVAAVISCGFYFASGQAAILGLIFSSMWVFFESKRLAKDVSKKFPYDLPPSYPHSVNRKRRLLEEADYRIREKIYDAPSKHDRIIESYERDLGYMFDQMVYESRKESRN